MATSLLTLVVPVVMRGLQDGDDDVRAVAASALLPVTDQLVSLLPQYVSTNLHQGTLGYDQQSQHNTPFDTVCSVT